MSRTEDIVAEKSGPSTVGTLLYILAGLLAWALQFTAVYGGHTLVCALGASPALASAMVIVVTAATAVALALFLLMQDRSAWFFGLHEDTAGRASYDTISRLVGFLSLVAILWTGATVFVLNSCIQGR